MAAWISLAQRPLSTRCASSCLRSRQAKASCRKRRAKTFSVSVRQARSASEGRLHPSLALRACRIDSEVRALLSRLLSSFVRQSPNEAGTDNLRGDIDEALASNRTGPCLNVVDFAGAEN